MGAPRHRRSSAGLRDERGFTLIELLAVMVVLGILAAIALPAFLGQRDKGMDADAKSNARNLVTHVESCFAAEEDYTHCDTEAELAPVALEYGTAEGEVSVTDSGVLSFEITAVSKSTQGGTHKFLITKDLAGTTRHDCVPAGQGGCPAGAVW